MAGVLSSWPVHVQCRTEGGGDAACVLRYEDLLDRPVKGFRILVTFPGLRQDAGLLLQAIRFSSSPELRKQEQEQGFVEPSPNSKRFFKGDIEGIVFDDCGVLYARRRCRRSHGYS